MPPINFISVALAGVVGWFVGALWYGVLGKQWMAALGWSEADMAGPDGKRQMPMGPMVLALLANVIMALMLAGVIGHIAPRPNMAAGLVSGALVWFGFVITTEAVNNAFQKRKAMLTLIDGGHWLAVLIVQGLVIGFIG